MGTGASLVLIAIGAILTFAVTADVAGVSLSTVGIILMIVGGLGFIASMVMAGSMTTRRREEHIVHDV